MGRRLREGIASFNSPLVTEIRGRGLLNAIVIDESMGKDASSDGFAWDICVNMAEMGKWPLTLSWEHLFFPACTGVLLPLSLFLGLLAKPTHGNIIRFAPPLCINDSEVKNFSKSSSFHPLLGWTARLHLFHDFSPAIHKFFCYCLITDGWSVGDIKDRPYPQVVTATHLPFHFFITALESASWLMQHTRELTMKERMFSDDLRGPTDTWHPISALTND